MRVLHLEDSRIDAVITAHRLAAELPECRINCAATREQFESAVAEGQFDLIVSDYSMHGYSGVAALEHARRQCPEKPFIFFSGTLGEKRALAALERGAADFVSKDEPAQLAPAIRRALARREPGREQASNPPMLLRAGSVRGQGEGILVIDDEQWLRELFTEVLTARGYRVYQAGSGAEGLAIFDHNRAEIALVLTDLTMEGMDGVAVIRTLRARAAGLPVLAMSGMAGTGVYDQAVAALGVRLLAKPLNCGLLLTAIRAALGAVQA